MANILKFFRRIHHATPAFSKEDLNDDKDVHGNGKVFQNNLGRQSSTATSYDQTHLEPSQNRTNGDKKVKFKKRKNLFDPTNNNLNSSPLSDNEFKISFRAKLFVSPNINRFKRFHSLNNENVEQCQSETISPDNNNIPDNFVFERVRVKKNTRYLRHSPDRTSFESMSPIGTPNHSLKNQQLKATANIEGVSKVTMQSNNISFDLKDAHFTRNEIYALEWSDNNSSALNLWHDSKNSLEDINNNNWEDGFGINMHHSSVSPMLSSISSSSTMDTWVDDDNASKSLHSSEWNDVTHIVN